MAFVLWRIECDLPPLTTEPPTPPMCPAFYATCVFPEAKGADRMGIELWWQSYGIEYRARHCHKASRCGITAGKQVAKRPEADVKCWHCTAKKHDLLCQCGDCDAERSAASAAKAAFFQRINQPTPHHRPDVTAAFTAMTEEAPFHQQPAPQCHRTMMTAQRARTRPPHNDDSTASAHLTAAARLGRVLCRKQ